MNTSEHTESPNDKLIPLSRAREVVGISRSKLYELLSREAFPPPVKIGRTSFFSEREIQGWISNRLANRRRPQ